MSYYIDRDRGNFLRSREHKGYIATFQESATEQDKAQIVAAPDLLDVARKALAAWTGDGPAIVLDELRAAIAKATGAAS